MCVQVSSKCAYNAVFTGRKRACWRKQPVLRFLPTGRCFFGLDYSSLPNSIFGSCWEGGGRTALCFNWSPPSQKLLLSLPFLAPRFAASCNQCLAASITSNGHVQRRQAKRSKACSLLCCAVQRSTKPVLPEKLHLESDEGITLAKSQKATEPARKAANLDPSI